MNFDDNDKRLQKKIDWIASQIRETKFELHRQNKELKMHSRSKMNYEIKK